MLLTDPIAIGNVTVPSRLFLAPMAGVTDLPMRIICRRMGCEMAYTEMVSANALIRNGRRTQLMLTTVPNGGMLGVQLFGSDPQTMAVVARSVERVMGDSIHMIDINMGCPASKIVGNGEGGALLKDLGRAAKIMEAVVEAVSLPVTVKYRKSYEKKGQDVSAKMARLATECGVSAITIHGRSVEEGYAGACDWYAIANAKAVSGIPVIGNGDVHSYADANNMMVETDCDAVMVGRAAVGSPWIFAPLGRISLEERYKTARDHLWMQIDYRDNDRLALNIMRKHLDGYIAGLPGAAEARTLIHQAQTEREMEVALALAFNMEPPPPYDDMPVRHARPGNGQRNRRTYIGQQSAYDRPPRTAYDNRPPQAAYDRPPYPNQLPRQYFNRPQQNRADGSRKPSLAAPDRPWDNGRTPYAQPYEQRNQRPSRYAPTPNIPWTDPEWRQPE